MFLLGRADGVAAQAVVDPTSCGHYETQADAQAALDAGNLPKPENLDWDSDGIACEEAFGLDPDSPPPARDYTTCGHFETQADAQAALDSGILPNPEFLDGDGDGIACEEAFVTQGATQLPNTGSGARLAPDAHRDALMPIGLAVAVLGAALTLRRRVFGE
jgi:hypothetical protein